MATGKGLQHYVNDEPGNISLGLNGYFVIDNDQDWRINGKTEGGVEDCTITNAGTNYDPSVGNAPAVTVTNAVGDLTGNGCVIKAVIHPTGVVANLVVVEPGQGYTADPTFTIGAPPTLGTTATGTIDNLYNFNIQAGTDGAATIPYSNGSSLFNGTKLENQFTAIKNVTNPIATNSTGRVEVQVKSVIGSGSEDLNDWKDTATPPKYWLEPGQILYGCFTAVKITSAITTGYEPLVLCYY